MSNEEKECQFCEDLQWLKKHAREYKKETGINTTYKVCLYEYRTKNRRICGSGTYKSVKLRYCPLCGRKLIKGR